MRTRSLEDALLAVDLDSGGIGASTHLLGQSVQAVMRSVVGALNRREQLFLKTSEMETSRSRSIGRHIRDAIMSYHNRYQKELMKTEFRSIGSGLNPSVYANLNHNSSPNSNSNSNFSGKQQGSNRSSPSTSNVNSNSRVNSNYINNSNGSSRYSSNNAIQSNEFVVKENTNNRPNTVATTLSTTDSNNNNINNGNMISNSSFGRNPMGNGGARPNTASPGVRGGGVRGGSINVNTATTTTTANNNNNSNNNIGNDNNCDIDDREENHQYRDAFRVQDFNRYSPSRYKKNSNNNEEIVEVGDGGGDDAVMLGSGRDSPTVYTFDNKIINSNNDNDTPDEE